MRLLLFDQIQLQEPGAKIRVLACVHEYLIDSATLVLKGEYTTASSHEPTAFARIDNVLESIKGEVLQVGAWVNIVGYVRPNTQVPPASKKRERSSKALKVPTVEVLMIWSAGSINLMKYRSAILSTQSTSMRAAPEEATG